MYAHGFFLVGYVGLGTVSAATWWYLFDEEGPQVSFYQLVSCRILQSLLMQHRPALSGYGFFYAPPLLLHAFLLFPAVGHNNVW